MHKEQQQKLNQLSLQLVKAETIFSDEEKIFALREVINYHDWRYYVLSEPVVTDFASSSFSCLKKES